MFSQQAGLTFSVEDKLGLVGAEFGDEVNRILIENAEALAAATNPEEFKEIFNTVTADIK
jgi:hypothetical protein